MSVIPLSMWEFGEEMLSWHSLLFGLLTFGEGMLLDMYCCVVVLLLG